MNTTQLMLLMCSVMSDSVTPWTVDHQDLLSMEFSRQEYWIGLPFPSPVLTINHNKLKDFCWSPCELNLTTQCQGPRVIYFKLSCQTSFSGFLM